MDQKMVSVITPCYNAERCIAETIESVLSQSYPFWEMIIVDDGSTDNSAEIIKKYTANNVQIRYVRQKNAGSASARNQGIRLAEGRYIALLDADDLWDQDFLQKQLVFMDRNHAVCAYCSYRYIDENSEEIKRPYICKKKVTVQDMERMNYIGCLTGLYDTLKYGKLFLDESLRSIRDDYAYWYEIVKLEGCAWGNPEVLCSYRVLKTSVTGNKGKLIHKQYRFYRDYLKLGRWKSCKNILLWGMNGLRKFVF